MILMLTPTRRLPYPVGLDVLCRTRDQEATAGVLPYCLGQRPPAGCPQETILRVEWGCHLVQARFGGDIHPPYCLVRQRKRDLVVVGVIVLDQHCQLHLFARCHRQRGHGGQGRRIGDQQGLRDLGDAEVVRRFADAQGLTRLGRRRPPATRPGLVMHDEFETETCRREIADRIRPLDRRALVGSQVEQEVRPGVGLPPLEQPARVDGHPPIPRREVVHSRHPDQMIPDPGTRPMPRHTQDHRLRRYIIHATNSLTPLRQNNEYVLRDPYLPSYPPKMSEVVVSVLGMTKTAVKMSVAQRATLGYMSLNQSISQRDLRLQSKQIMDAVEHGEEFIVTRDGRQIGELIPLRRQRTFVQRADFAAMSISAPIVDPDRFRADLNQLDQETDDPYVR